MTLVRMCIALILAVVGALASSGCSANDSQVEMPTADSTSEASPGTPNEKPSLPEGEGSSTPSEKITNPGATIALGKWASYEYSGTVNQAAVVAARLLSIDKASTAQEEFLVAQLPELEGYTAWILLVEQKKISGAPLATDSDYAAFFPVDAKKKRVQYITMIGWDDCRSQAFTKGFDDGSLITQCIIAATKVGDPGVAGVIYAPFGSLYDAHDGNPINFMK